MWLSSGFLKRVSHLRQHFKATPIMDGGITLDFSINDKNPISKPAHLHFKWAEEKCPVCGSALMMIYCPTDRHEAGIGAALTEQNHKTVISCLKCSLLLVTKKESV
jgi:hypothetical protein